MIFSLTSRILGQATALAALLLTSMAVAQKPVLEKLVPFLEAHCYECHDEDVSKGDLDLANLALEPQKGHNAKIWEHVFARVEAGEMPPAKKPKPAAAPKKAFLTALEKPLLAASEKRRITEGRVHSRRLTRREYEKTLHDILGIDTPLINHLPEDPSAHGFQTVAEAQQLSLFHLEDYLQVADIALEEAFDRVRDGDSKFRRVYTPQQISGKQRGNYRGPQIVNGKLHFWHFTVQYGGRLPVIRAPESGHYRITIDNVYGINGGKDQTVWGILRKGYAYSNDPLMYQIGSVEAVQKPKTLEFTSWLEKDDTLLLTPVETTNKKPRINKGGTIIYQGKGDLAKQGFPAIVTGNITLERVQASADQNYLRKLLLDGVTFKEGKPTFTDPKPQISRLVHRFGNRAFRRNLDASEIQPYADLALAQLAKDPKNPLDALHAGYRAILCSPRFLTLVETPGKLDTFALASRLSYAFWNSAPDWKLREAAQTGELSKPDKLWEHAERYLENARGKRFLTSFTDQWLDLGQIDFTTPDPKRFWQYDLSVRESMLKETRMFVWDLIENDRSITNLIDSDFIYVDGRLADLYQTKGVKVKPGSGMQRVSLPEGSWRGGLVTQASILKVTADGSTTSPILRGVWVAERLLGMHILPPPPNIPAVEPDIRGATSIRDQLDKHRSSESCNGCHAKIDPAGFALETFDPVGRFRMDYGDGKTKKPAKVDPSGVTPDGRAFKNHDQWQAIYKKQPELLTRAFATQFLTYATGAPPVFADRPHLDEIVAKAKKSDYGMRSIIRACLESPTFQTK